MHTMSFFCHKNNFKRALRQIPPKTRTNWGVLRNQLNIYEVFLQKQQFIDYFCKNAPPDSNEF